jgi:hypothetical protein
MSGNEAIDLSALLRGAPRNCWLALSEDESKIVGSGRTVTEVVEEAKKAGVEDPVVVWSPRSWLPAILGVNCEK